MLILFQENAVHTDESLLITHDAKNIESILVSLTEHKDDSQQRSWALHLDEPIILEQLNLLLSLLVGSSLPSSAGNFLLFCSVWALCGKGMGMKWEKNCILSLCHSLSPLFCLQLREKLRKQKVGGPSFELK